MNTNASLAWRLLARTTVLCTLLAPMAAQKATKPRLIIDVNELADGEHGDPADPHGFPLTRSSFPDSPRTVGDQLFFLAHDVSGLRKLYRLAANVGPTSCAEVALPTNDPVPNPRFLTLATYTVGTYIGPWLYFVAGGDGAGGNTSHRLFRVTTAAPTELHFTGNPVYVAIDAVITLPTGVAVIAYTSMNANGSGGQQAIWRQTAADTLTQDATWSARFVRIGGAVRVEAATPYYAFSADGSTARSLVIVAQGASTARELAESGPVQLTAFDGGLVFVNQAVYESGASDVLRQLDGATAAPKTIASYNTIRNLGVGSYPKGTSAVSRLVFSAQLNNADAVVTLDSEHGWTQPSTSSGNSLATVAQITILGGKAYVLGTQIQNLLPTAALWRDDPGTGNLYEVRSFPQIGSVGSLRVWPGPSNITLAFVGLTLATQRPVISYGKIDNPKASDSWISQEVYDLLPGTLPDQLAEVNKYLYLRAHHRDRGCEPWYWVCP